MNKEEKNNLNIFFSKQTSLLRDISNKLASDLCEYYDLQLVKVDQNNEYEKKIKEKIINLEKIKVDLIKIYCKLVSEY
jgi:archaellum biogenesis ATPase FlaH